MRRLLLLLQLQLSVYSQVTKRAPHQQANFRSLWVNPFHLTSLRRKQDIEECVNTTLPRDFNPIEFYPEVIELENELLKKSSQVKFESGPPLTRLGDGTLKVLYLTEYELSQRILYVARGVKIEGKRAFPLSFYTEPTGHYQLKIYICELTKGVKRWAVMQSPCQSDLGMKYGYVGYVSQTTGRQAYLTNNRAMSAPFGTRVSAKKPCCKGSKFKGFKPCCHYRFDPQVIYLPPAWGAWSQWTECGVTCGGGVSQRTRRCFGEGCEGLPLEEKPCNTIRCGGPYGWMEWSEWGECSRTCGGGVRYRERNCEDICPMNRNYHKEPGKCNWFPCLIENVWGEWGQWAPCSASCELGKTWRAKPCEGGPCMERNDQTAPKQIKDCFDQYCNHWSEWLEWSGCNKQCNGGTRSRKRYCVNGMAGLQGCPGSGYGDEACNTQTCANGEQPAGQVNEFGIERSYSHHKINSFQQDCLDFHNFFRALHNLNPVRWDPDLFETAKLWSKKLIEVAPESPAKTRMKTKNWPHSDSGSKYRKFDVGENISWDLSENGSPCYESVYRWYAELFYYNPKNFSGRRGAEPIGHLTQLLWASTNAIGCARTQKLIKQPPNYVPKYQRSGYTVCHYAPQGNIIGLEAENWNDLDEKYCSTYDNYSGENQCGTGGTCQGLQESSECGCTERSSSITVPMCSGRCLVECANQWGTPNYWPRTCIGTKFCTCGIKGAVCQ